MKLPFENEQPSLYDLARPSEEREPHHVAFEVERDVPREIYTGARADLEKRLEADLTKPYNLNRAVRLTVLLNTLYPHEKLPAIPRDDLSSYITGLLRFQNVDQLTDLFDYKICFANQTNPLLTREDTNSSPNLAYRVTNQLWKDLPPLPISPGSDPYGNERRKISTILMYYKLVCPSIAASNKVIEQMKDFILSSCQQSIDPPYAQTRLAYNVEPDLLLAARILYPEQYAAQIEPKLNWSRLLAAWQDRCSSQSMRERITLRVMYETGYHLHEPDLRYILMLKMLAAEEILVTDETITIIDRKPTSTGQNALPVVPRYLKMD